MRRIKHSWSGISYQLLIKENHMKRLMCLLLLQLPLYAQLSDIDLEVQEDWKQQMNNSEYPRPIKPFELYGGDLPPHIKNPIGKMEIQFEINENGEVENPIVLDTFNVELNDVVIDKVKQSKYQPAKQNGRPVKVRFKLPIIFQ